MEDKTYTVELTYNEIHIILNSLDEFVDNNRHSADLKAIAFLTRQTRTPASSTY